ncbi:helix-turn-helix domain-containing protein [uncultured Lamprocystis sp.]|jgi:excisionase family DNA binding protein|uniref:helix-turn-helix domain-containing protein n=1 Tax=uncultured Lamprocystis sp. TaxID=543132 RepID=UPI00342A60A2
MTDPLLVDLAECARQLGQVSTRTVRRLIDANSIRSVRVGRRLMVTMESLREYVNHENANRNTPDRVKRDVRGE